MICAFKGGGLYGANASSPDYSAGVTGMRLPHVLGAPFNSTSGCDHFDNGWGELTANRL
jgi:hypothetical protein